MQFIQNSSEIVKKKNSVVQYIQTMYVNVHKNAQILLYSEHTPVEDVGRKLQLLGHDPIHFLSTHNKLNNSISTCSLRSQLDGTFSQAGEILDQGKFTIGDPFFTQGVLNHRGLRT